MGSGIESEILEMKVDMGLKAIQRAEKSISDAIATAESSLKLCQDMESDIKGIVSTNTELKERISKLEGTIDVLKRSQININAGNTSNQTNESGAQGQQLADNATGSQS